jgi:hypothetical protein
MKVEFANDGHRAVGVKCKGKVETVHPRTTRVLEVDAMPTGMTAARYTAAKTSFKQVADDAEVTPVYKASRNAPAPAEKSPEDAAKQAEREMQAMKTLADILGVSYSGKIGIETLSERVTAAKEGLNIAFDNSTSPEAVTALVAGALKAKLDAAAITVDDDADLAALWDAVATIPAE